MHLNLNRLDKPFLLNPQYIDKDPHESSHLQRHSRETTQRLLWTKKMQWSASNGCIPAWLFWESQGCLNETNEELLSIVIINFELHCFKRMNFKHNCGSHSPFCLSILARPDSGVSGEVALEPSSTTWICVEGQRNKRVWSGQHVTALNPNPPPSLQVTE